MLHCCTGRCKLNVNARVSSSSCGSDSLSSCVRTESLTPAVLYLFSSCYVAVVGSTHRHCGVSDCVARRLPDLGRAPGLQQVLGESPARLRCHLSACARLQGAKSKSLRLAPNISPSVDTRARERLTRVQDICLLRADVKLVAFLCRYFQIKIPPLFSQGVRFSSGAFILKVVRKFPCCRRFQ